MKIVDRTDWKNPPAVVVPLCSLAGKKSLFNPASPCLADGKGSKGEPVQVGTRIKNRLDFKVQAHINQISVVVIDII